MGQVNPDLRKFSLPDSPAVTRFSITRPQWPANHGDYEICLWYGAKVAAITFTVDDHACLEHTWWKSMRDKYGIKTTWFVVGALIDSLLTDPPSYFGNFTMFRDLYAYGFDVQSHTWDHSCSDDTRDPAIVDSSYRRGQKKVLDSIPGSKPWVIAWPCGRYNLTVGKKYYIAGRSTNIWTDVPGKTNFMYTNIGPWTRANILTLIDSSSNAYRGSWARYWHAVGWPGVTEEEKQANRDSVDTMFSFIRSYADSIWYTGSYMELMKYSMEFATKIFSMDTIRRNRICFTIGDSMVDSIYDFPLSVKIRVSNSWASAIAIQNGDTLDSTKMITRNGNKYVICNPIPDRGQTKVIHCGFPDCGLSRKNINSDVILARRFGR